MTFVSDVRKTSGFILHREKNFVSIIKITCLWLPKQMIAVYGDVYTKHFIPVSEQNAKYEGWNFNSGNYLFTTDTK